MSDNYSVAYLRSLSIMLTVAVPCVPIVTFASAVDKETEKSSVLSTTSSSTIFNATFCIADSPGRNSTS